MPAYPESPFTGADQKSPWFGQTDANDPLQTLALGSRKLDTIRWADQFPWLNFWGRLVLKKYFACALVLCCLVSPAEAAGIQLIDSGAGLAGAIWYPCVGEPKDVALGKLAPPVDIALPGVKNCPVVGAKLPLVIFSHGRGGWFGGHNDTAEALANAGFVVAAVNHPGDSGSDSSQRDSLSVLASRPADMIRLLDFMLSSWKDRAAIDPTKVGFFGFSAGAYTGLVLAGGNPDFRRIAPLCTEFEQIERLRTVSQQRHSIQPAA